MLQDIIHPPEQLQIEEIPSPLSAQIFEFCDPELFQETVQNSEVGSSSNCCYEENNSYSFPQEITKFTNTLNTNTAPTTTTTTNNTNISIIFDSTEEIENDISASIDFSPSPPFSLPQFVNSQENQFDLSSLQSQIPGSEVLVNGISQYHSDHLAPMIGQQLPAVYEDECLSSIPSCSFLDHTTMGPYLQGNLNSVYTAENSGIFSGGMVMGNEFLPQELDFQGDNAGIFCPGMFTSSDLQALSNESQHLVSGGGSSATPLPSEISSVEDSSYKVGKLTVEERKEKIHRYMKKRNERNFSKKIKYACRKTLADSRPRVRGRFAKNDEFGDTHRTTSSNHEEDTDDDVRLIQSTNYDNLHVVAKEEDEIASDIFAHISGVNSFKCNYPIQSWI